MLFLLSHRVVCFEYLYISPAEPKRAEIDAKLCCVLSLLIRLFYWNHPITITNDTVTWKRLSQSSQEEDSVGGSRERFEGLLRFHVVGIGVSHPFFLIRRWHFRTDTLPRWLCLPLCSRLVRRHRGKERLEGEISIKLSDIAVTRRKTKYKPSQKRKEKKKHSNCCRMLKIIPDLSDTLEIKKKAEEKLLAQRRK